MYLIFTGKLTEGVYRVPGKGLDSDALAAKFEEGRHGLCSIKSRGVRVQL